MKIIEIKNRWTDEVIYSGEYETLKDAVISAVANCANLSGADLNGANLRRADLSGANLNGAYLSDANLSDADLSGADLSDANLNGANLRRADLSDANLSGADLSDANLSDANLRRANLRRANLRRADLSGANLRRADLSGANLSDAKFDGFPNMEPPQSLAEAAQRTKEWLLEGHWMREKWIETPTGAYAGDCKACLHGAAVYVGGPFGSQLSDALRKKGYTEGWNDEKGRTLAEVGCALDEVINA